MRSCVHWLLCTGFFAVLLLPMSQKVWGWASEPELSGVEAAVEVDEIDWSLREIFSGRAFAQLGAAASTGLGLRGHAVQLDNLLNWEAFGVLPDPLYVGADGETLFSSGYSIGSAWVSEADHAGIRAIAKALKMAQDGLAAGGVRFLPIISPAKQEVLVDALPVWERALLDRGVPTRLDVFREHAAAFGLEYLDGVAFLEEVADDAEAPLFTRGGVHWSNYAGALITVRLLEMLDAFRPGRFRTLRLDGVASGPAATTDKDLAELTNLPDVSRFVGTAGTATMRYVWPARADPRVLFVGTSFIWNLAQFNGLARKVETVDCFYYNQSEYAVRGFDRSFVRSIANWRDASLLAKIQSYDLVVCQIASNQIGRDPTTRDFLHNVLAGYQAATGSGGR